MTPAAADHLETYRSAVATVITALRRDAGLTQEALAQRLGWNRCRVRAIEAGRCVEVPELFALADALCIDPILIMVRIRTWVTMPSVAHCYRAMLDDELRVKPETVLTWPPRNNARGWLKELRSSSSPFVSFARMARPPETDADGPLTLSTA